MVLPEDPAQGARRSGRRALKEICGELGAEVIEVEVMPDHVYLPVEVSPAGPLSVFVQTVKGRSSRLLSQEFPLLRRLPSLLSPSLFASTFGDAPLDVVRRYVEKRKQVP